MKRPPRSMLPEMALDRDSGVPMYRQCYQVFAHAIRNGTLPCGTRLPSTRVMARRLGVSRNTVLSAYEELAADGLIAGKIGSGTQVSHIRVIPGRGVVDWRDCVRQAHFPARIIAFTDSDGNSLYLNY